MKLKMMLVAATLVLLPCGLRAEVGAQDLLNAVDKMTPDEAQLFYQKMESKFWKPLPEGFFTRMSVSVAAEGSGIAKVNPDGLSKTGGELDMKRASGGDITILWNVIDPKLRLGVELGSLLASDSKLEDGNYARMELQSGLGALVVNYQLVKRTHWYLFTQATAGVGGARLETLDTPKGQASTIRSYDASFTWAQLQAGAAWRPNPVLTLFLSGGYRFAERVDLKEGGDAHHGQLDLSGASGRLGVAFNF
ncbi:MAG: hypothetical protein EPN23_08075 [Verrucomicrobia bacterium]|nr:MAG: hypothetical protein EPN23_08075 [Verrucomicrobiota bacterium]